MAKVLSSLYGGYERDIQRRGRLEGLSGSTVFERIHRDTCLYLRNVIAIQFMIWKYAVDRTLVLGSSKVLTLYSIAIVSIVALTALRRSEENPGTFAASLSNR
jgi:hypothetical protein